MSSRLGIPAYYFLLHPVSTALFIYTLLLVDVSCLVE